MHLNANKKFYRELKAMKQQLVTLLTGLLNQFMEKFIVTYMTPFSSVRSKGRYWYASHNSASNIANLTDFLLQW